MSGWNPLLGVAPTSTYEALETLALASEGKYVLDPGPGTYTRRWPFRHMGDGLVHSLLSLHRTKYWSTIDDYVPIEAITECGILALLSPAHVPPRYDSGEYIPDAMLTCLRCASGVDEEGVRYRQTQKQNTFAQNYGMSADRMSKLMGTNQPNMQQIPRKR